MDFSFFPQILHGADVSMKNQEGQTPYDLASVSAVLIVVPLMSSPNYDLLRNHPTKAEHIALLNLNLSPLSGTFAFVYTLRVKL